MKGACWRASGYTPSCGMGKSSVLSGAPFARNGSGRNERFPFKGRLPFGQRGSPPSAAAVGATRGTHIGEPDAAWTVVLLVSPLKRGSGLCAFPQRPIGSLSWTRAPLGEPSGNVQPCVGAAPTEVEPVGWG